MKIAIGSDHAAEFLKNAITPHLVQRGLYPNDLGLGNRTLFEYPVIAKKVADLVAGGTVDLGILLCGTGVGVSIVANKVKGVRAVVCSEPYSAKLSKQHNDTNVLCLGSRVVGEDLALMIVDAWIDAEAEGGRHAERVGMIAKMEETGTPF